MQVSTFWKLTITDRLTSAFAAVACSSQLQQSQNRHGENNVAFGKKNKRTGALVCAGVHLVTNSTYPGEALISFGFPAVPPLHVDTIIAHWSGVIIAAHYALHLVWHRIRWDVCKCFPLYVDPSFNYSWFTVMEYMFGAGSPPTMAVIIKPSADWLAFSGKHKFPSDCHAFLFPECPLRIASEAMWSLFVLAYKWCILTPAMYQLKLQLASTHDHKIELLKHVLWSLNITSKQTFVC